ncbi:MAG: sigma-54 dependent transcriptional regulator [bacterium]|nr:sigma-54 dependent transcriptional regulator [bacterium]
MTILVVDDEVRLCDLLRIALEQKGYEVKTANNAEQAIAILKNTSIDLVLSDIRMPGMNGLDLLKTVKEFDVTVPVILMTAYGAIESAIQAMRDGAYHYLLKPFDKLDSLELTVAQALKWRRLLIENQYLRQEVDSQYPFKHIIGTSPAIQQVFELIRRVAPTTSTVLITGESGTGKELVARAIHEASLRKEKPMVKVNCVAIPDTLLESELFGHVKGAFTDAISTRPGKFELADKSTIFLDEIGDMSLSLQAKILRVLQEREFEPVGGSMPKKVEVRVIAATNRSLRDLVQEGKFREDLYFRLNVVPIYIAPLRKRKEDIPELVSCFLKRFCDKTGKKIVKISPEAMRVLMYHPYPGNVRELENLIERAVVLCSRDSLEVNDLYLGAETPFPDRTWEIAPAGLPDEDLVKSGKTYREAKQAVLAGFERKFFTEALRAAQGNVSKAAEAVGMHRKNFYEKLNIYQIDPDPKSKIQNPPPSRNNA